VDEYTTVASRFRGEVERIKGSRFLADVAPVVTPEEAEAFLAEVRAELDDATHHCWAYRLGCRSPRFRSSDDGEPGGSAGRPILQQLEGHELSDAVVVVTRWFGGTKLGVGGLMRAYGGAAGHALDRVERRVVVIRRELSITYPYECSGAVEGLLAAHRLTPTASEYTEHVRQELAIPVRELEAFLGELRDRCSGRVDIEGKGARGSG